jgi:hypothetical protein
VPKMTFSKRGGRIRSSVSAVKPKEVKTVEEVVSTIRDAAKAGSEEYRERSLAIHGMVCARCGREFSHATRHLLTVHHRDGNHDNNPPDGSNWENLCVYCHEDIHSRGVLGEYLDGASGGRESVIVFSQESALKDSSNLLGALGRKLSEGMKKKQGKS